MFLCSVDDYEAALEVFANPHHDTYSNNLHTYARAPLSPTLDARLDVLSANPAEEPAPRTSDEDNNAHEERCAASALNVYLADLVDAVFAKPPDFQKEMHAWHMWNTCAHDELDAAAKV